MSDGESRRRAALVGAVWAAARLPSLQDAVHSRIATADALQSPTVTPFSS
jgi:hypothetical protein